MVALRSRLLIIVTALSVGSTSDATAFVIELRIRMGPQGRKPLVARHGQEPRGSPRLSFETTGLAPHIDENIADDIFSQWSVLGEPQNEAIDSHMAACVQL